jgi:hypothetical protein
MSSRLAWPTSNSTRSIAKKDYFSGIGRQQYGKFKVPVSPVVSSSTKLAEAFRKLVKHIKLLQKIPLMMKTFQQFRGELEGRALKMQFLDHYGSFELPTQSITAILEFWKKSNYPGVDKALKSLNKENALTTKRYFHCELQLLQILLRLPGNNTRVLDFIGCSKRSCYMCWEMLRNEAYSTNDTHARLYHLCAFPFDVDVPETFEPLKQALFQLQTHLFGLLPWNTGRIRSDSSDCDNYSETIPYSIADSLEFGALAVEYGKIQASKDQFLKKPSVDDDATIQVLRIPQDGTLGPQLEPMRFINIWKYEGRGYHIPLAIDRKRKAWWVAEFQFKTEPIDGDGRPCWAPFWITPRNQYRVDQIGAREEGRYVLCRTRGKDGNYLPENQWTLGKQGAAFDRSKGSMTWPWRGDIFIVCTGDSNRILANVSSRFQKEIVSDFQNHFLNPGGKGVYWQQRNVEVLTYLKVLEPVTNARLAVKCPQLNTSLFSVASRGR